MTADIMSNGQQVVTHSGLELGAVTAAVCSWERNRSILWAIVAGVLSWVYVIYFLISRRECEHPKH